MKFTNWYKGLISVLLPSMLVLSSMNMLAQKPETRFLEMKGTLFTHKINDKDSLSEDKIIELRNEKGIVVWFSRDIYKEVCLKGLCRMIHLKIYWTGTGNYLGLKLFEPLTKTDHVEFKPEDYEKLDRILSDSLSILKGLKIEDLTVETGDLNKDRVDATSGATNPTILEYVVKDAVYTCYTLWYTVYGSTREKIRSILEKRVDKDYLRLIFEQKDPQYLLWAIDLIDRHAEYHQFFYHSIIEQIKTDDPKLSQKASHYFTPSRLSDASIQKELAIMIGDILLYNQYEIIRIFSTLQQVNNDAILILLEQFENKKINAGMLGTVCKMIGPENMVDSRIVKKLERISEDKNLYVRDMAQKLLSGTKN